MNSSLRTFARARKFLYFPKGRGLAAKLGTMAAVPRICYSAKPTSLSKVAMRRVRSALGFCFGGPAAGRCLTTLLQLEIWITLLGHSAANRTRATAAWPKAQRLLTRKSPATAAGPIDGTLLV